MNIKLEIEKYNYYRLLGESYEPKSVDFALSKNMKYIIIENVLFDLEKNKSLGVYYKNSLIIEQTDYKPGDVSGEWEWPWEDWSVEDWIDLGVAGISTALDVSGIGTGAAKAIDIVHGLSFIYRGISRNNNTYTIIGLLSIVLAAIPGIGSGIKGVIVGLSKTTVGRSTKALIQYLKGNKLFMDTIPPLMNKIMGKLKSIKSWIDNLASQYTWVDDIWSKVKSSWNGVVKWFEDFMNNFKSNIKRGADRSALSKSARISSKVASDVDYFGKKAGDVLISITNNKIVKTLTPVKNLDNIFKWVDDIYTQITKGVWTKKNYLNQRNVLTKKLSDLNSKKNNLTQAQRLNPNVTNSINAEIASVTSKIKYFDDNIKLIDDLFKGGVKGKVIVSRLGYILMYWQLITTILLFYNEAFCVYGVKQDEYEENEGDDNTQSDSNSKDKSDTGYEIYDFVKNFHPSIITDLPVIGRMLKLSTFTMRCDEIKENETLLKESINRISKFITDKDLIPKEDLEKVKDAAREVTDKYKNVQMTSKKID